MKIVKIMKFVKRKIVREKNIILNNMKKILENVKNQKQEKFYKNKFLKE